ncbi:helix-turn-helix domain-containing protein [Flavisolibacter ginsenosidimutans]|uniref:Helix-turn-helix transcriptional regulator n=1 Tax=Flavisolibacter ginsenosidimutans TaxID=661481 RepID=A0A5B8UJ39_9BACT|nr:AraC family transcriptional regulator [Flavisolibacter ginsenosidimutans]QEC56687.1 helix-turn-helix transcriptional regulator [Flavisolibacter ginsenosidimutans]
MSYKTLTSDEKQRLFFTKTYLLNHLHRSFCLSDMARYAAMGLPRFNDGFLLLFGSLPMAYLHESRLQFGYFLLLHTDKPIKEIAGLCGYRHYKNFLTAFRKRFGVCPSSLRGAFFSAAQTVFIPFANPFDLEMGLKKTDL